MVVRIDISKLPSHLRHALMNEIGLNNRSRKSSSDSNTELSDIDKNHINDSDIVDEVIIVDENNSHTTTRKLKDALIRNRISDYVVIKHLKRRVKFSSYREVMQNDRAHIIVALAEWNLMIV